MTTPQLRTATSDPSAFELDGIGKRFGRHWAVAHVDLSLNQGEALLLIGANGSGKTTLLRMIAGLLRPNAGSMRVLDLDGQRARPQIRESLSLVSHRTYLYESLTALEHVRLWRRLSRRQVASSASDLELLHRVGLERRADDRAATFSAGMRKRLTLLRAHIEAPNLLLLDEPFAALDPAGQQWMTNWLTEFTNSGRTLVLASHALERARAICTAAVVMRHGQIVWRGPAEKARPELLEPDAGPGGEVHR